MGRKQKDTDPATLELREIESLMEEARRGFKAKLPRLRELLAGHPEIIREHGDPSHNAEEAWLARAAGGAVVRIVCLKLRVGELRAELAGPTPSSVESQLVNRAVIHWLRMNYYELLTAQNADGLGNESRVEELARRAQADYLAVLDKLESYRNQLRLRAGNSSPSVADEDKSARSPGHSSKRRVGPVTIRLAKQTG